MKRTTGCCTAIRCGLIVTCLVLSAVVAHGQTTRDFTDASSSNSNWNNTGNWSPTGKPVAGDTARIDNDRTAHVTALDQAADEVHLAHLAGGASGTLIIRSDRTLTVNVMSVGHNGAGTGTLNQGFLVSEDMQSGHLTSGVTRVGSTAGQQSLKGVYNHLAGTHQTGQLLIGAFHPSFGGSRADGTYNVLGASATIDAGNVILGDYGVDPSKTGRLNINASGASISFGQFTQNAAGTLSFTADAFGFSAINVAAVTGGGNGSVTLAGTLVVDLAGYEGSASELILLSNAGTDSISGTFADIQLLNNTRGYYLTYTGGTGNDLALIPEPAAIFLIALAGVGVLFGRRRFFTANVN